MTRHPLLLFAILCGLATVAPARGADEADRLSRSAELDDVERAAALYEARLSQQGASLEARLGAARALVAQMAIRTHGNLPLVDGLQDDEANRSLWSELGSRALEHARAAHDQRPDSVEAAAALANSYMFYASSLGVVSSILKGAGSEYREHASRLIELDPTYGDGLGDTLLAGFYLVAPWPIGDGETARSHYERAAELSPMCVRNQYGLGVYWAREGETSKARTHFERALGLPCSTGDRYFCDWMKQEMRRVLASLASG